SIAPDLPPRLDAFFARAFARDPAQRFQSARELAEAFCSIAMDAAQGAGSSPVSSSRASDKRTMRMDLMSVPPPPPSSDAHGTPMVETAKGTLIMREGLPARWPPPPPGGDDDAATVALPSQVGAPPAMALVEPEP